MLMAGLVTRVNEFQACLFADLPSTLQSCNRCRRGSELVRGIVAGNVPGHLAPQIPCDALCDPAEDRIGIVHSGNHQRGDFDMHATRARQLGGRPHPIDVDHSAELLHGRSIALDIDVHRSQARINCQGERLGRHITVGHIGVVEAALPGQSKNVDQPFHGERRLVKRNGYSLAAVFLHQVNETLRRNIIAFGGRGRLADVPILAPRTAEVA